MKNQDLEILELKLMYACRHSNVDTALQMQALMNVYAKVDKELSREIERAIILYEDGYQRREGRRNKIPISKSKQSNRKED